MNERIKYLRKELLHMTMEEFGKCVGVVKSTISNIENGTRNVTDQMCKSICREFNVREEWLRHGEGEPFHSTAGKEEELSSFHFLIYDCLSKLSSEQMDALADIIRTISK